MRRRGGGDEGSASHVGGEQLCPLFGAHLRERGEDAHSGCVDDGVQPAEGVDDFGHGLLARRRVGHVADDGGRAVACLLGGVLQTVLPACEKRHLRALLGEADSDATPEPGGAADDSDAKRVRAQTLSFALIDPRDTPTVRSKRPWSKLRIATSWSPASARRAPTVHCSRVRCSNGSKLYQRQAFS